MMNEESCAGDNQAFDFEQMTMFSRTGKRRMTCKQESDFDAKVESGPWCSERRLSARGYEDAEEDEESGFFLFQK